MGAFIRFIISLALGIFLIWVSNSKPVFLYLINREFINNADTINGHLYNYGRTNFINNKTKVILICKVHNVAFYAKPQDVLIKNKILCPLCTNNKQIKQKPSKKKRKT